MLKTYLYKSLGIQEGEMGKVLLMQVNIFLIICASLIVKPIANGLFLSRFGVEQLPVAFLLVAVAAVLVSLIYTRVLRKYAVVRVFRLTFIASIIFLVAFGIMLSFDFFEGLILYMLYIWFAIFALIAASQFWIIANYVFTTREAKRLFGLLGAGAISGAIVGGYLTSILANFLNSEYLLFLCALLLLACIPITERVWRTYVAAVRSPFEQNKPSEFISAHPFQLIRKSRHLSFMAAIAFVGVLVAKLVDYQFAGLAVAAIEDPDKLTAFFGFWFSTFNVISLIIQIFVTRRVVGTFGVGSSLFFLPGFIFGAAALLLVFPELLFAAVFLKMTEASLKQSVNRAAMELLILPVPTQIRNQTKTFIDVVVDSVATGCTGLLLIFIIQGFSLPVWVVTLMIIGFCCLWIYLAHKTRREYVRTFSRRIEEAIGVPEKKTPDAFDFSKASVLEGLRKVLRSGSESQILFVLRKLSELKEGRLYQEVTQLLEHSSDAVKVEVLRYLSVFRRNLHQIRQLVEPLMYSESQDVKIEAFECLLRLDYKARYQVMHTYLNDADYRVRIAAMVSLARESRVNPELKEIFGLHTLIREGLDGMKNVSDPAERRIRLQGLLLTMGYARIPEYYPFIDAHCSHPDREVAQYAFLAAGKTTYPFFIDRLIEALGSDVSREAAIDALRHYGPRLMPVLRDHVQRGALPAHVLKTFPIIASRVPSRESVRFCFDFLRHEDRDLRIEAIKALSVLKEDYPDFRVDRKRTVNEIHKEAGLYQDSLSLLYAQILASEKDQERYGENSRIRQARQRVISLLEGKMDADLEMIFQLLCLHYASQEMLAVYDVLCGEARDTRSDALELLENLIEPNLKKTLIPIIEVATWDSITDEIIRKLNIRIPSEYACYQLILDSQNRQLKHSVLHLLRQLQDPRYLPLVEYAVKDPDPGVRENAVKTRDFI